MRDQTFEVEVTADRLDAAQPVFAAALFRQSQAAARGGAFPWLVAVLVSGVIWPILMPMLVPEAPPKVLYGLVAGAIVFQVLISVWAVRLLPATAFLGISRWNAGVIVRRTKKRAPFTVRYRVDEREYQATIDQLGIVRGLRAGEAALAYRTPDVILFFKRPTSQRPRAFVYLANDDHRRAMDRFLEAGSTVVHDLFGGGTFHPAASSSGTKMADDLFNPNPNIPTYAERPGGGGCGRFAIGCGMVVSVALVLSAVGIYLITPGFVVFTVQTNIAEVRDTIEQMPLDPVIRDELVGDFNRLRLSVDDQNHFRYFQWLDIHRELKKLLDDRRLDPQELTTLRTEIGRMKKIQGIEGK